MERLTQEDRVLITNSDLPRVMGAVLGLASEDIGRNGWSRVKAAGRADLGLYVETALNRSARNVLLDETHSSDVNKEFQQTFVMTAMLGVALRVSEQDSFSDWEEVEEAVQAWQLKPTVNGFGTIFVLESLRSPDFPWADWYARVLEMMLKL